MSCNLLRSRHCCVGRLFVAALLYFALLPTIYGQEPAEEPAALAAPPAALGPTVRALLDLPRETPTDHFRAVVTLMDLGAMAESRDLLTELAARELTDAERAELVREFGTYRMMQLLREDALAEIAGPFVEQCMAAAAAAARDPQRLNDILNRLRSESTDERRAAMVDLADAGIDGVQAAIEALASEKNPQRRAALRQALIASSPLSIGPTLALLSTNNPQVQSDAIRVLATLRAARSLPLLAVPALTAPGNSQLGTVAQEAFRTLTGEYIDAVAAEERLSREIDRYVRGMLPETPDAEGHIELWFWNDSDGRLSSERFPSGEASIIWAARLAEDLHRLNPADMAHRQLAVLLGIEAAKLRQGYDRSLAELTLPPWLQDVVESLSTDPFQANELLAAALAMDCVGAAVAASEMLAAAGDVAVLDQPAGGRPPLAEAMRHADRRVRFAAVEAIMSLDPQTPYAGSSRLPELLEFFSGGGVASVALVGGPLANRTATIAGLLETAGYTTEVALTGNDLVRLARSEPDTEMVVVDVRIQSPGIRDVIVTLRAHPESATLPIAVLVPAGYESTAYRLAQELNGILAVPPPHSSQAAADLAERLSAFAGRSFVPLAQRADQASTALDHLARLFARDDSFYDLRRRGTVLGDALYRPALSERAIAALEMVGTPDSQRRLLEFASRQTAPLPSRQAAASAFDRSVNRHGVLLTTDEIRHQYDLYNASASSDVENQQLLGQLLDSLESRREAGL